MSDSVYTEEMRAEILAKAQKAVEGFKQREAQAKAIRDAVSADRLVLRQRLAKSVAAGAITQADADAMLPKSKRGRAAQPFDAGTAWD